MTTTENIEFESVEVESQQLRIPSDICTDPVVFEHIFSTNTWNKVFTRSQREKIQNCLPPEIRTNPAAITSTMRDLFSGNLTRFGSDPLKTFFNVLNMGGYDPEVNKLKNKIKRQWRRESLRRKRNEHTKLMQDIVISTQTCLHRLQDKKLSKIDSQNYLNSKPCKAPKSNNKDSVKTFAKKKLNSSKPSPLRQKVAKSLHNEILAMNTSFLPPASSSDDTIASKKPVVEKKPPKPKKPKLSLSATTDGQPVSASHVKPQTTQASLTIPNTSSSNLLLSQLNSARVMKLNEPAQPSIQMAKFPSVIPPSLLGVINVTQGPPGLTNPKPYVTLNHDSSKVTVTQASTSSFTQQVIQRHVLKSSPILASQLQAPIALMTRTTALAEIPPKVTQVVPTAHVHHSTPHEVKGLPMTQIKVEEESSSEDEFEAIEPTIGFSTMVPVNTKPVSSKSTVSKSSSLLNARLTHVAKSLPTKKTVVTMNSRQPKNTSQSPIPPTVTLPVISSSTTKTYTQTPTQSTIKVTISKTNTTPTPPNSSNKFSNINTVKMISGTSLPPFVSNAHSTSAPGPSTTTAVGGGSTTKLTPNLILTVNSHSSKILPFTMSNLSQQSPSPTTANTTFNTQTFKVHGNTISSCTSALTAPVLTSSGMPNGASVSTLGLGTIPTTTTMSAINHQKPSGILSSTPTNINMPGGVLRSCVSNLSPIPLTLSDLSQSLNLGLDVSGDKLEDKIDDLPVLDGSAFDSIPNLSDDLDVFDLDLVDGLCDFEVMLSEEKQYSSFFALIREVLCSTQNHRMTLNCLEKTVRKWATSPSSALNIWFSRLNDWNEALPSALNFLAGNYQEIHPEDFVPYIEYKFKTKYYQWIGAGRDNDNNLSNLCNMWLDNLDKLPPVKKQDGENEEHEEEEDENEDSDEHTEEVKKKYLRPKTPPPPRFLTEWTVRPSSIEEKSEFQIQEKIRFDNPHKAFTYRMHEYESVVGPVKGVYSNQTGVTNKARGHSLLVDDRPPYVTILALVRDSVARLPNGEGTRSEICEMLRDSAFLAPEASNVTLNSVVSGALDRLHYERDPCVRYDSHKKNWIYLHRDRSQEQFERLHHNRSYTKSTKSRNTNGRKSRKKTLSQSSGTVPSTSTAESSTAQSSNSSVSSTPSSTPTLSTPTSNNTTLAAALSNLGKSSSSTIVTSPGISSKSSSSVASSSTLIPNTPSVTNTNPPAPATTSVPNIEFTVPITSSGQSILSRAFTSVNSADSTASITQNQQINPWVNPSVTTSFQNQSQSSSMTFQSSGNLLYTNKTDSIANIKMENPPTQITPPTTLPAASTSSAALQQQNLVLNSIFRFPNMKLPENVRFMRIHQTPAGQGQMGMGSLRLPHQRIVLRQAFGGSGQGVLLGQTANGHMVIISTAGAPTGISPTQPTNSSETTAPVPLPTTSVSSILNMLNTTNPSAPYIVPTSTSNSLKLNQNMVVSPNHVRQPNTALGIVRTNPTTSGTVLRPATRNFGTAAESIQVSTPTATQPRLPQLQQLRTAMQFQPKSQQTESLPQDSNQVLPSVVRTNQMEYLIPGHHVALGRGGVRGLKMIPVSTSGNQIFARLVAPSQGITVNSTQASTSTTSEAKQ